MDELLDVNDHYLLGEEVSIFPQSSEEKIYRVQVHYNESKVEANFDLKTYVR
jgi:hypothetical protein